MIQVGRTGKSIDAPKLNECILTWALDEIIFTRIKAVILKWIQ